jgi:hypothetical protein
MAILFETKVKKQSEIDLGHKAEMIVLFKSVAWSSLDNNLKINFEPVGRTIYGEIKNLTHWLQTQ